MVIPYNRKKALEYAKRYALIGNPEFFDFENYGGNCTSFVSQCLYYSCEIMNPTQFFGWYYYSSFNRSPSWTSVNLFYNFITGNKTLGPFAKECDQKDLELGDLIQLKFYGTQEFSHSLIITTLLKTPPRSKSDILVSAHSSNVHNKPLSAYYFEKARYLKIEGIYQN